MLEPYQQIFLVQWAPAAVQACRLGPVRAAVALAWAARCSDWGRAAAHFNCWELDGRGDRGEQLWITNEPTRTAKGGGFRAVVRRAAKYSSPAAAMADWARRARAGQALAPPASLGQLAGRLVQELPQVAHLSPAYLAEFGLTSQDARQVALLRGSL